MIGCTGIEVNGVRMQLLRFADDIAVIAQVGMNLKRALESLLGRPRRRWVDNIRMDLQEVGCGYMDWIGRTQDTDRWRTLVSAVMNLGVP